MIVSKENHLEPRLHSGDRIRISSLPSGVSNITVGLTGVALESEEIVAGNAQVKIRLDDGRKIVWKIENLEVISKIAPVETNSVWDFIRSQNIIIDAEVRSIVTLPKDEEYRLLEENILAEGCRDPLVVWKRVNSSGEIERAILDGCSRYNICTKHNIPFTIVELEFVDRHAAQLWIIRNQLGRRNLSPLTISYFRGKLYNQLKQQGKRSDLTSGKNCTKLDTADKLANEFDVSDRTIKSDGRYAENLDCLGDVVGEDIVPDIISGRTKITKNQTSVIASATESYPEVVKEAFSICKVAKDIIEHIKEKTRRNLNTPFPFAVGEIVWISSGRERSLLAYRGFWGVIKDIHEASYHCEVLLWNGSVKVRPEHLKSLQLDRLDWDKAGSLARVLNSIHNLEVEASIVAVIKDLSSRPVTCLNVGEKQFLRWGLRNKLDFLTPEISQFLDMEISATDTEIISVVEEGAIEKEANDTNRSENKSITIEVESDRCDRSPVSSEYDRDYYFRQPPEIIKTNQLVREVFEHLEHFRLMHILGLIEGIAKRKPDYIHRFATALTRNEEQAYKEFYINMDSPYRQVICEGICYRFYEGCPYLYRKICRC
ncbi:MAG: hypothetical protein QNJ54_29215 [Prochloraceae cyanobacterium]|nr:hypothetical protein [Prochloraceae cyanobacterium]